VGLYDDHVLPRLIDLTLGARALDELRARTTRDLAGEVVEVGFGSGRNLPHYSAAVTRVLAVEPSAVGRKLAAGRIAASPVPVDFVGLDGEALPLADASVDHVVSTWTLCTIPDVETALEEIHRVLRPGGTFRFLEHGRSPDPGVARWQDRLTPVQRRVAGGCHLNRPIADLVDLSSLDLGPVENYAIRGPRSFGWMYEGTATRR
jgi:ubiquinone/menaquinone biosynthesis C-methylase UbiE